MCAQRKPGRPRAGKELLSPELICAAGLRLVDQYGIEALGMRRLAAEMNVDPMAIYHHLPGKDAVLSGMIDLVFAELSLEVPKDADWRARVRAFARGYRRLAQAHPHLALHLALNLHSGTASVLAANEVLYEALEEAGLPLPDVANAADLIVDFVNGHALAIGLSRAANSEDGADLSALLEEHPPDAFPALRRTLRHRSNGNPEVDFEDALEMILDGIECRRNRR